MRYLDLVKLEAAVLNAPFLMDDCAHLYRLASKLDLENASDVIMAYRYMLAVDWTARNISKDSTVGPEISKSFEIFTAKMRLVHLLHWNIAVRNPMI